MGAGGAGEPGGPGAHRPAAGKAVAGAPSGGPVGRPPGTGCCRPGPRLRPAAANNGRPGARSRRGAPQAARLRSAGRGPRTLGADGGALAWPAPLGPAAGCRLQVRGPRRIVRPSDRAHCAAGGGGRAGAHLPSAAAALIGVLPEQLRPGPRDPGRDPQLRRAARPPCASCRDRATLARPGPPSTVGVGECPGHSEGWTAPLFSQPVRMSATLHSSRGGRGRPVLGPTADPGPRIPHRRWNRSQPMGGGGFPAAPGQPSSGHRVRSQPQGQCPHLADRAFTESLCGILGSAIFFLLLGWASLGGPEVRLALSPSPCLSGKFLRPRAGRQAEQGRRRVR